MLCRSASRLGASRAIGGARVRARIPSSLREDSARRRSSRRRAHGEYVDVASPARRPASGFVGRLPRAEGQGAGGGGDPRDLRPVGLDPRRSPTNSRGRLHRARTRPGLGQGARGRGHGLGRGPRRRGRPGPRPDTGGGAARLDAVRAYGLAAPGGERHERDAGLLLGRRAQLRLRRPDRSRCRGRLLRHGSGASPARLDPRSGARPLRRGRCARQRQHRTHGGRR